MGRMMVRASRGWAARDFREEDGARRLQLRRRALAAGVTVVAFLVFLVAIVHEQNGCQDACYGTGLRSYEGGHGWTSYADAWQWQAQWAMALAAVVLGLAALATSERFALRRWTVALTAGAAVLTLGWVAWRLLEPAIPV
jgi:hypothetical protein